VVVSEPGVVAPVDATEVSGGVAVVVVAGDNAVVVALESPPESRVASKTPPPATNNAIAAIGPQRRSCLLRSAPVELAGCMFISP
jgi:hypothetical protein